MTLSFDKLEAPARAARYRELNVAVAHTLATYVDVAQAVERVLALMGASLRWQFGAFWKPDATGTSVSCMATWSDPDVDLDEFERDARRRSFGLGTGVLGAAWDSGRARWLADIAAEPAFLRADLAGRAGLRSAVYVPVPTGAGRERNAVIEFLSASTATEDADLIEMLETVGVYVDQFMRLRAAEQDLKRLVRAGHVDIGVVKQLAAAREALRQHDLAKAELLATASHELRTPLTTIAGFTSTMLDLGDRLDGDQKREFLQLIDEQTLRLRRLVDELHLYSRLESGHLPVHPARIDTADAIRRAVDDLGVEHVAVVAPPGLDAWTDPDHFQQMLANYVSNALKYGAPPITIEAVRADGSVVIAVTDHGPGVSIDFAPRLFDRFERGSDHPDVAGTGLGLSIVRGLARAQGGDAWHEPSAPHGARFCVRLPAARRRNRSEVRPCD